MTTDRLKNLKKHLDTQIKAADAMGSEFVYIRKKEAEVCLELAEVEDTIMAEPVPVEIEGGGRSWWYVCGECHTAIDPGDKFCRQCGRKVLGIG